VQLRNDYGNLFNPDSFSFLSQELLNWSSVLIYLIYCLVGEQEEFEDTKGIIRIH